MSKNKHGLERKIPTNIKEQVKRDCYYGCVICGNGLFEFEHIDPEYKDCTDHDPKKICLLCPNCHAQVTKGAISKIKIKELRLNPHNKNHLITRQLDQFKFSKEISIKLGSLNFVNVQINNYKRHN